ncbi:baculoviral IAP repeat-containing protein 1 isoform 2-T2 [Vipera latastei]
MAAQQSSADISNISELDSSSLEAYYTGLNLNFSKFMEEMELDHQQVRNQLQRGFNPTMRSEAKRLKTFPSTSNSFWMATEMAAAGFYYNNVKSAIQCFCCGLVLLKRSSQRSPFECHKNLWSSCEFILGKEVGNISKYDIRVRNPENNSLEVKNKYKEMESRLESFTNWPFYCKEIQPALLSNAGFYFTGIKDTVQCFSCSGCLGNWEEGDDPWKEHAKWFPECEFLQREKSEHEIKQYIQSYCGFLGITGKHFTASARKCLPSDPEDPEPFLNIYKDEEIRLESFKTWPQDAHADPAILAKAGFFYTGSNDTVQCFCCSGYVYNWEETDDPWEEHVKFFPHCKLSDPERWISSENTKMQPEAESQNEKQTYYNENFNEIEAVCSTMTTLASYWAQYPNGKQNTGTVILKAYMLYSLLKYPQEVDHMKAVISACGELALQGLFKSLFNFSEKDLSEVGVNEEEALYFGLLTKFTAQRLHPLYKFFHLSFQEFLAGQRMSELLASDVQEDVKKGLEYLRQINTFVKISGRYQYILRYACSKPSKAVPIIISHLLNLLSCKKSCESHSDNTIYLQQTPELNLKQYELISTASTLVPECYHSEFTRTVLKFATELAYQSNMVSSCAPMILEFLTGKEISLDLLTTGSIRKLCLDYPESLFLPSRFNKMLSGRVNCVSMDSVESVFFNCKAPLVEPIYNHAFELFSNVNQKLKENIAVINSFQKRILREIPDCIITPFLCVKSREKIPYLKFVVSGMTSLEAPDIQNLKLLFSFFDNIELNLYNCNGLLESIKPVIEENLKSFKICSLCNNELNELEENLLLSMSSLESLVITGNTSLPETLFANLDKYTFLKELLLDLPNCHNIFDTIPEGFKNLHNLEKLILCNIKFKTSSARLAEFIRNFPNLSVFHLKNSTFLDMGALMGAMSSCKKLTEILLNDLNVGDKGLCALTAVLPNFIALKMLDLSTLYLENKEASTPLALALGSLKNLEHLVLPSGEGIRHAAKLIVQQCFHFPNLRMLQFNLYLSDEGLLEIAKVAADGGFQKLEFLCLSANHKITEETWRNFFQTLSNMPSLQDVNFGRTVTYQIKCQAATVKSFVQCVSRLPNLRTISMIGWLFDEKDLNMFEVMKEQHPQSKDLSLIWKCTLPFAPIIDE